MLKTVWNWILSKLFGVSTETSNREMNNNDLYAEEYRAIDEINFTSIFANKLSNYVVSDSTVEMLGVTRRTEILNTILQKVMDNGKKIVGMALGYGGVVLVPYVKDGKLQYNIVEQNRMTIDSTNGELITGATIIADQKTITYGMISDTYFRLQNSRIENNRLIITQKYVDEQGREVDVSDVEEWRNIKPVEIITNVDRVLFGYIKCPINNRIGDMKYGVPITFGCENTIAEIKECLKQVAREFKIKEGFIGVDETLFKDGKLPKNGLFKKFNFDSGDSFEEYSPQIRESSYYARLQELYTRLEKQIGTSKGVLTDLDTSNATATEIKRAMYDTFALVSDIRKNVEKGLDDFMYACNVLANVANLTPVGDYEVNYNWDYSLLEDSQETYSQMMGGINQGVISKAELRNFIVGSETIEESKKAIEEIESQEPTVEDILATNK